MLKNKRRSEDKQTKEIIILNAVSLLASAKTCCFSDVSAPIAVTVA